MSVQRNILVFPCGSEVALDIFNAVRYSRFFHLVGASSVSDHGMYVYEDYIGNLPFLNDPGFIPAIRRVVEERAIDAIFPAMDSVISKLKEHEGELGCKVIAPEIRTTSICLEKRKTYELFADYVPVPELYDFNSVQSFPVFIKPNIGYGGHGTRLISSKEELSFFAAGRKDLLIMENLPGEEYTVDCFTDRKGDLLFCSARVRNRIRNGISVNTFFVDDQSDFLRLGGVINSVLSFRGAWFFQVKRNNQGRLVLMEIAPRIGGSSLLSKAIGVNLALLTLFDAFDVDVAIQKNAYEIELDRALDTKYHCKDLHYNTVYVDYDDCIILNGKIINSELIKFLYECVNEGKHIVLLTKHQGDLDSELKRFRLVGLFDEILHIAREEDKITYISDLDSIFIDDSFSERALVQSRYGIPVFGPDMIDVLLK